MKTPIRTLAALFCLFGATQIQAQGTAFTYQGRLDLNGTPVSGSYDLRFTVYDAVSNGSAPGGPLTNSSVNVSNGLFATSLDFGADVFTGQARWLQIEVRTNGVGGFSLLSPRQLLTATPYAIHAGNASNVVNGTVVKSLNNLRDNVALAAGANVTLATNGNTLTISSTGVGGAVWSLSGANTYYNSGGVGIGTSNPVTRLTVAGAGGFNNPLAAAITLDNTAASRRWEWHALDDGRVQLADYTAGVTRMILDLNGNLGIGSTTPNHRLRISGGPAWTANGWAGAMEIDNAAAIGWRANAAGNRFGIGQSGGGLYFFNTASDPGNNVNPANYVMMLSDAGNVGLGTLTPLSKLDIAAQDALRIAGYQPFITMSDLNGFGLIRKANRYLQVADGNLYFSYRPECNTIPCNQATETHMTIRYDGNVGIGTFDPQAKLHVIGTTRTSVLTITGGADIAEPFKLSSPEVAKGSVVVIDEANPGHLKLSTESYDTRVAGIVSGANGIRPGISLHQEGAIEGGENVALSGRVYVLADAENGNIKPGDLLTTSSTPGHAMKVTDHAKAQGAILGKAMTGLKDGKGMVLVLVTLQ